MSIDGNVVFQLLGVGGIQGIALWVIKSWLKGVKSEMKDHCNLKSGHVCQRLDKVEKNFTHHGHKGLDNNGSKVTL